MSEVVVFVVRRDKTDLVDSLSRENASARMVVAVIRSVIGSTSPCLTNKLQKSPMLVCIRSDFDWILIFRGLFL